MRISKSINSYVQIILIFSSLLSTHIIQKKFHKPSFFISKQNSSVNLNPKLVSITSLGHKRLISSLFWIFTIIESDHEHYKKKDLNSWMFLRFKFISELDPSFLQAYTFGGLYLSIIKDDIPGASEIYKKGLLLFPHNKELIKDAFYHFYFQANEKEFARNLLKKNLNIIQKETLLLSLLARHESSAGNLDLAYNILVNRLSTLTENSPLYKKIRASAYAIKAEKDLTCLNNTSDNSKCDSIDFDGEVYLFNNKKFYAAKRWEPFKSRH